MTFAQGPRITKCISAFVFPISAACCRTGIEIQPDLPELICLPGNTIQFSTRNVTGRTGLTTKLNIL